MAQMFARRDGVSGLRSRHVYSVERIPKLCERDRNTMFGSRHHDDRDRAAGHTALPVAFMFNHDRGAHSNLAVHGRRLV